MQAGFKEQAQNLVKSGILLQAERGLMRLPTPAPLRDQSNHANATLQTLISAWHKNAMAVELLAEEAKTQKHAKAVEMLTRHINTLETRIKSLKGALNKRPPDKM